MLRHIALFKWADGVDADHVRAAGAGLDELPGVIEAIVEYRHGPDLGLSDTTLDYAVVADFLDAAGYAEYRDHPEHRAFIERYITGHVAQRCAVQFALPD